MITADNSDIAIKLRRYKSELYTAGLGYILFGLWSGIKIIMSAFLDQLSLDNVLEPGQINEEDYPIIFAIYIIVLSIAVIVVLLFHLYVGLGAIRSSRGAGKKRYLFWTRVFFVINVLSLGSYFLRLRHPENLEIDDTVIASFLVDLTVTLILFGIIRSDQMIKKITAEKDQGS